MAKYEVGQEVRVSDINGQRSRNYPSGGFPGVVTKVGRKLLTVKYQGREQIFRIESGRSNDGYGHQHVSTLEQAVLHMREGEARKALKETDFEIRLGRSPSLETLEAVLAVLAGH